MAHSYKISVSDLLYQRCRDVKTSNNNGGCYCVGGRLYCVGVTVALMMCWASVTQSDGRHMCFGSHGGGQEMGLAVGVKAAAGVGAMRVKTAGFLSFACLA